MRSESEERIAWGGADEADVELAAKGAGNGFDTNVVGGRGAGDEPLDWRGPGTGMGMGRGGDDKDRIVKTVHINQFSEND